MNRKQRRTIGKQVNKDAVDTISLMLNIPTECLTCKKTYDKLNKEMVRTWVVDVFSKQKRVDLYCPECDERRKKDVQYIQTTETK